MQRTNDPVGSKHVGANSVTSVTAYVILYSYIKVHKLVQIESGLSANFIVSPCIFYIDAN